MTPDVPDHDPTRATTVTDALMSPSVATAASAYDPEGAALGAAGSSGRPRPDAAGPAWSAWGDAGGVLVTFAYDPAPTTGGPTGGADDPPG
jgi:hypothetical protein